MKPLPVIAALVLAVFWQSASDPSINLEKLDDVCAATKLNFTANHAVKKSYQYALSNSFGFGGTNASLAFVAGGNTDPTGAVLLRR